MAVLLCYEDREYLVDPGDTLETDLGVLEVPDDVEPGATLETHLGEAFEVRDLRGPDLFDHLERTGAPMVPRDVGLIVGETGIQRGDRVLDAGTGTGILAAYLGRIGANVTTFEIDPEFAAVARSNMETADVTDHVTVHDGDVTEQLEELSGFDVLTLDTADAPAVVERAPDVLAEGGYVAVYSPFVEDTREVVTAARDAGLSEVRAVETIQRTLDVDDRGTRPSTAPVGHTGYLVFGRHW